MTKIYLSIYSEVEIIVAFCFLALLIGIGLWMALRKRPSADEIERRRREFLAHSGRIVDGMLLDIGESELGQDRLNLLVYSYRIGGVDYECSQDLATLTDVLRPEQVRAGFPCSVRYQRGNPQNSIVVGESWSGLRAGIPVLPAFEDSVLLDIKSRRPGRKDSIPPHIAR